MKRMAHASVAGHRRLPTFLFMLNDHTPYYNCVGQSRVVQGHPVFISSEEKEAIKRNDISDLVKCWTWTNFALSLTLASLSVVAAIDALCKTVT